MGKMGLLAFPAVGAFFSGAAAFDFGSERFGPLLEACHDRGVAENCSAEYFGRCVAHQGERFCTQHHASSDASHEIMGGGQGQFTKLFAAGLLKVRSFFEKGQGARYVGDCAEKQIGEPCAYTRPGQCVDSGMCPVFQGQVVCKLADAHPPSFLTRTCRDKSEGDACSAMFRSGTCHKAAFETDLVCQTDHAEHPTPAPAAAGGATAPSEQP